MSQPPQSGPPYPEQPYSGQPYPGQPASGQPYGQPGPGQPYGQPAPGQPYPGQTYGQPNPDVPSSVPPQPGFPPPAYGVQPGYPAPEPPKRKSRTLPIVLVAIAVVLVLCVGGGTAAVLLVRNSTDDVAEAIQSSAPQPTVTTTAPATEPTPTEKAKTITVVEPKKLGGRPKLTDEQFAGIADQLESELSQAPGATTSVGALYGRPAERDIVVIAGVAAPVSNPAQELNGTFFGAGVGGLKVTGITEVDAGPLGGEAKCGKANASGVNMALCAWADDGSVGWIIWYFKSVKQAKGEFVKLRGEIEKSS
jgi:hypothetical protein